MRQLRKYCAYMLLLATLALVTACGRANNGIAPDNNGTTDGGSGTAADGKGGDNGTNVDDILFDTDGDGAYDHSDVDGDGLLEEIGKDTNDLVDDVTEDGTMVDGTVGDSAGTDLP